mmetsp:Transcript_20228/g.50087  ORF Transcript_20228/g.50087 Transcript_20228/m.50087 type:complete len:256 (-) Transcript_20228:460-1227(-)
MLAQDGASWLRFCYLLEETQLGQDCRVFVVQLEEENADNSRRPYWLLVLPSGSVSRSCREVAEWGGFDRHAFDLVRQRVIVFASLAHFHPTYLVPAAKDLADKSRFAVIPDEMSADAASSATWDEAFELSKERWDREGLQNVDRGVRGSFFQTVAALKPTTLSRAEERQKLFFWVQDRARVDPGVDEIFMEMIKTLQERTALSAATAFVVQGQVVRPAAPLALESSNPKRSSSHFRAAAPLLHRRSRDGKEEVGH